jgi:hypothetical protein
MPAISKPSGEITRGWRIFFALAGGALFVAGIGIVLSGLGLIK